MLVAINSFVRRQTWESPYTYFDGSEEELLKMVKEAINAGHVTPGYRDGVILVKVNPLGFLTGVTQLKDGDKLVGDFTPRREGETPRISIRLHPEGRGKQDAKMVDVICYRHDVLVQDGDAETDAEWEVISLNGYPTEEEAPIEPFTLMHNHFGSDGGTATQMSAVKFEKQMRESFHYWKDKAMIDTGD